MRCRVLLCGLLALVLLPCWAQSPILTPMVMQAPLRGVVTIIAPDGQFYINLGQDDQLRNGAELLLSREGRVLGRARVIKVGRLDAIAELPLDLAGTLRLESGDNVQVQQNPPPTRRRGQLPHLEPEDDREFDAVWNIVTALFVYLVVTD